MTIPMKGERSSAVAGPPTRQFSVRAQSVNEEARTFEAVVASETPVVMIDFRSGELIDEILLATGGEFPALVPLLDSHQRGSTTDVIGSMTRFRRNGTEWAATGRVATGDQHADSVWAKIRDGHLDSLSIGYRLLKFEIVHAGESKTIAGRQFKNRSDRTLRVVTSWQVDEVSLVAIPADSSAKIRCNFSSSQNRSKDSMSKLTTPAIHTQNSITGRPSIGALVSGLMERSGINDPSKSRVSFRDNGLVRLAHCPQFEEEADRGRSWAGARIVDLMRYAMEGDGVQFSDICVAPEIFIKAHQQSRSGISSGNLGQLFSEVFGALFLQGFDSEPDSTAGWTSESDNLTLKPTPRARTGAMKLERRGPGETAKDIPWQAASETTQLAEYSARFSIDEQDIINNQFGYFEENTPQAMGVAAKRLRPDLVFAILLANPTMRDGTALFHANHANLQAASPVGEASLESAQALIGKQAEGGQLLNLLGRYIIVPQRMSRTAAMLAKEVELLDGESTPPPVVRTESRIDNGVTDPATGTVYAGSDTTWFLSAAGREHTIEVQYLEGTGRQPTIRQGFLDRGRFGTWFDVQHFIGSKAIDWRGLVKSTA